MATRSGTGRYGARSRSVIDSGPFDADELHQLAHELPESVLAGAWPALLLDSLDSTTWRRATEYARAITIIASRLHGYGAVREGCPPPQLKRGRRSLSIDLQHQLVTLEPGELLEITDVRTKADRQRFYQTIHYVRDRHGIPATELYCFTTREGKTFAARVDPPADPARLIEKGRAAP